MGDDDKTREELIAELHDLRQRLSDSVSAPTGRERSDLDPMLEPLHRAVTEDQRLVSRFLSDGTLTFVSDAFCEYFGKSRTALLGRSFLELIPASDRDQLRAHIESLGPLNTVGLLEHRVIGRSGEARWHVRVDQVMLNAGAPLGEIASVARDITDQRRTTAELRKGEATVQAFFEAASEGIVGVDRDGRIALVNPRIESMFGYGRDELLGHSVERLIPERSQGIHAQHRVDYFAKPRARSMGLGINLAGRRKDGTEFPIEVSLTFAPDERGGMGIAFVTDISQRVAQERQARHVEKLAALGSLAAGIAHEINNPIGVILSRIELMLMDAKETGASGQATEDLEVLYRQAKRLRRIAEGLLSFGRTRQREHQPVDLREVVEDTLLITGKQLGRDGIRITTSLAPDLPRMRADATALEQVVMNLLLNARDAMPSGGTLRIETLRTPDQPDAVSLVVADTGVGMAPDVLARISEPFFTTKPTGTGLGLSVSYTIIREHGGTVHVASEQGRGTTVTVTFPATR